MKKVIVRANKKKLICELLSVEAAGITPYILHPHFAPLPFYNTKYKTCLDRSNKSNSPWLDPCDSPDPILMESQVGRSDKGDREAGGEGGL